MGTRRKTKKPSELGGKAPPARLKLEPDEIPRSAEGLLAMLSAAVPKLKLSASDLEKLASRSPTDSSATLREYLAALQHASSSGMVLTTEKLLKHAAQVLSHDNWRAFQLRRAVEDFHSDIACDLFLSKYLPVMGKNIFWKPFVDELNEYDEESMIAALIFDDMFETYLKEWDASVVMAEEAMIKFGFGALAKMEIGGDAVVEIGSDRSFSTNREGVVTIAPYVGTWEERETNMEDYLVSFWHEVGHHKWRTFDINMHPDVFDYGSFGAQYQGCRRYDDGVVIRVAKGGETLEIRNFEDIGRLVEFPELLYRLHNWIDDGRVDQNNMEYLSGLRNTYARNSDMLFERRAALEGEDIGCLLEATLQYSIAGRTRNEVPEGIREDFTSISGHVDAMERGMDTDGTASMNAAIKAYTVIERRARKEGEGLKRSLSSLPLSIRESDTEPRTGRPSIFSKPKKQEPKQGEPKDGTGDETKPGGERFSYDGWDGEKLTKAEHVIIENKAEGEPILIDEAEALRIRTIFKKFAPKEGMLVRGLEDGDVDPELFDEYMREVRNGRNPGRDYHSRVIYEERDVATGVLIDLSDSTLDMRGEILQACGILGLASMTLKDPLIVAGFTSGDTEEFILMKGAQDNEIRGSDAGGGTPVGGPLRHMCFRMKERGIRHKGHKQVFLITDGEANVGKSPLEDAARAVDEAWKRDRVKVFGIGITSPEFPETKMMPYFDRIFGIGNYLIVSKRDVADGRLHHFFERYYRRMANKLR
ncbi:MAG: hypothetical protein AB1295_01370 [Candidatus Micrarchaeota archaeon]